MHVIQSNHRYWLKWQSLEHVVFFHSIWPNVLQRLVCKEICVLLLGRCSSQITESKCLTKWVILQFISDTFFVLIIRLCCLPRTNQTVLSNTNVQLVWLACAGDQLYCKYVGNIEPLAMYVCEQLVVQCKTKNASPTFLEVYTWTLWSKFRLPCATGLKSVELYLVAVMLTWCYNDMMYQLELISFRVNETAPCYRKMCYFLEEKKMWKSTWLYEKVP